MKLKKAWWKKQTRFVQKELRDVRYSWARWVHYLHTMLPTAQEIIDELRIYIDTKSNEYGEIVLSMEGSATRRACFYSDIKRQCNFMDKHFVADSLAEAVAEMRLRCKENNFLPPHK